jgi:ribonuclease BN (tRNA processing enzyme)
VRLTVLGSSGTHPGADRVCASHLVEHEGYRLLLDCGNGSLSNLLQLVDATAIDQVLLSHLHPDHFADLYGLYYALRFAPEGPARVPLAGPAGTPEFVTRILSNESVERFAERLPFTPVAAGQRLELGPFVVTLHAAAHPVEALAARVEAAGRVLAYSGDSGPTPALVECARDADLFLCDSTWAEADGPHPPDVHCTGAQAGRLAAQAGAARLWCTHVAPETQRGQVAAEAGEAFPGEVHVTDDLDSVIL